MVQRFIFVLVFLFPFYAQANFELKCEGWYQEPSGSLEIINMPVTKSSDKNVVFETTHKGYEYRVDWNIDLTSLYTLVNYQGQKMLFATARVPTENHRDSFINFTLPNGLRIAVNCEIK